MTEMAKSKLILLAAFCIILTYGTGHPAEENLSSVEANDVIEVDVNSDMNVDDVMAKIKAPSVGGEFGNDNLPSILEVSANEVNPPPGSMREAAPVTSATPARLYISPAARMNGSPGEAVSIEFLLFNVGETPRYFAVNVNERTSAGNNDGVVFPSRAAPTFFYSLSESKPYIEANETRTLVLTLRIPDQVQIYTNKTFTLEVQPYGTTASGR